jgi:hypothetical protein
MHTLSIYLNNLMPYHNLAYFPIWFYKIKSTIMVRSFIVMSSQSFDAPQFLTLASFIFLFYSLCFYWISNLQSLKMYLEYKLFFIKLLLFIDSLLLLNSFEKE